MPRILPRNWYTAHSLRWIAVCTVLAIAALLRFWALGRHDSLIFDEIYYVRDAVSQLRYGYPTGWPDDDPLNFGSRITELTAAASTISHPPLGKWIIGFGILVFGADTAWGWRSAVALIGTATVALTMLLGWRITRNWWIACTAGLLLAFDGVHVVLSRVSLLDGPLTFLVLLGTLFVWEDIRSTATRPAGPRARARARAQYWVRPWLWAAAASFGAATAVKWSGLFALAACGILLVCVDVYRRRHLRQNRVTLRVVGYTLGTLAVALPIALTVYVTSWLGWILTAGGSGRTPGTPWWQALWSWHTNGFGWHSTLTAEHPYQAAPLTWPLGLRPTAMYLQQWGPEAGCAWEGGCVSVITPLPNILVTWGGVLAILALAWVLIRSLISLRATTPNPAAAQLALATGLILAGYLSGWLPWVFLVSRSAVFQFYMVVTTPFAALALALVLGALATAQQHTTAGQLFAVAGRPLSPQPEARLSRQLSVACYLILAVLVTILFFPVWSGAPIAEWFWRAHLWLPGWA